MLQELVPVQRHLVTIDMLPDRPKWRATENVLKLEHRRTFIARDSKTQKPVIGVVSGDKLVYCEVDTLPSFPLGSALSEEPIVEFLVSEPEWTASSERVDMHTTVSLDFVDTRYIETVIKTPVEMFVKTTLARARPNPGSLEKFRSLVCTPEALSRAHATRQFRSPAMQEAMDAWRLEQPQDDLFRQRELALKRRETQLQVVLLAEIYARDPSVEPLLDAHFDRLLLWQALSETAGDALIEFTVGVLWAFFRHFSQQCHDKVFNLVLKAKGKPLKKSKDDAAAPEPSPKPSIALRSASRSVSLLERARSLRFEKKTPSVPVKRQTTIADSLKPNKREVEVSFKSVSVSKVSRQSTLQSQSQSRSQGRSQSRHEPPRKRVKPVHVEATPVANRIKELPMEDIEQPNLEVESTDEDE